MKSMSMIQVVKEIFDLHREVIGKDPEIIKLSKEGLDLLLHEMYMVTALHFPMRPDVMSDRQITDQGITTFTYRGIPVISG